MNTTLTVLLIVTAVWIGLRYLPPGADRHRPLIELIALIDLLALPLLVLLVWSVLAQDWAQCLLALLEMTLVTLLGFSYSLRLPLHLDHLLVGMEAGPPAARKGGTFTVMTLNCRYGRADPRAIVRAVERGSVDFLALQEVSDSLVASLKAAGLDRSLPYRQDGLPGPDDNGGYNVLYSRRRPACSSPDSISMPGSTVPVMEVRMDGRTILLASAHPKSPQRGAADWGAGLSGLTGLTGLSSADGPTQTVVMGDLNADFHHPSFRALLARGGFRDASFSLRREEHRTFPAGWGLPALIEIDHILLTGGLSPTCMKTVRIPGSDHLGLVAGIGSNRPGED